MPEDNLTKSVDRFHLNHIPTESLLFFSGQEAHHLAFDFLNFHLDLPIGLVVTDQSEIWQPHLPRIFLFPSNKLDTTLIKNLEKRQIKRSKEAISKDNCDPRAFLVLDLHAMTETSWPNKATLEVFFSLVRRRKLLHLTILVLLPNAVLSHHRDDLIDYLCHWGPDYYLASSGSSGLTLTCLSEVQKTLLKEILEKEQIGIVNLGIQCHRCQDLVFWYHLEPDRLEHFRLCHPKYWGRGTLPHNPLRRGS